MVTKARLLAGVCLAIAATVAACGGRVDLSTACSTAAVAYCQANGCPLTGPTSNAPATIQAWCAQWPSMAPRVTGAGICSTTDGQTWAVDVRLADAGGGTLYLLYDPTSGDLVSVSTIGAGTDAGTGETDYGTCGAHSGIVTCAGSGFRCR